MRTIRIVERVLVAVPIMLSVAISVFLFMHLTPGDPVDVMLGGASYVTEEEEQTLRKEFGLDKPLHEQLMLFLGGLMRGDLGNSFTERRPAAEMILERLPASVELALGALLFGLVIAVPIGIISAVKQNSLIDRTSMAAAFVGISMPGFWLGLVLIMIFSVRLHLLPVAGRIVYALKPDHVTGLYVLDSLLTGNFPALVDSIKHLILPSVALGSVLAAIVARVLRSSMLEVLRADYVSLARAKGLREYAVVVKHALRNALIPTITVVGIQIGVLLGGNMIIETVFAWPGLGRLVVNSIFASDYPVVQGTVIVYAFIFVLANLLVDILYTFLNPKITM